MSTLLFVTLEGCQARDLDLAHLVAATKERCDSWVPSGMRQGLRLTRREEEFGISLEPFVRSASLRALLGLPAKRPAAKALLRAVVDECQERSQAVGLVFVDANRERVENWPVADTEIEFERAVEIGRSGEHWLKLDRPMRVFHVPRVEARLWTPLQVAGAEEATHYFREYWVRARSVERAMELVREHVAADQAVLLRAEAAVLEPRKDAAGFEATRGSQEEGVVKTSGRAYFTH